MWLIQHFWVEMVVVACWLPLMIMTPFVYNLANCRWTRGSVPATGEWNSSHWWYRHWRPLWPIPSILGSRSSILGSRFFCCLKLVTSLHGLAHICAWDGSCTKVDSPSWDVFLELWPNNLKAQKNLKMLDE